ncbi:hypothetical protein [Kibdelosporangium philippinense]
MRTPDEIGIGSTLDDLKTAYDAAVSRSVRTSGTSCRSWRRSTGSTSSS